VRLDHLLSKERLLAGVAHCWWGVLVQVASLSQASVLRVGLLISGALVIQIGWSWLAVSTVQVFWEWERRWWGWLVWAHCWVLRERVFHARVSRGWGLPLLGPWLVYRLIWSLYHVRFSWSSGRGVWWFGGGWGLVLSVF
jgi:hypothetical protein